MTAMGIIEVYSIIYILVRHRAL